jgi:hypothetical protein
VNEIAAKEARGKPIEIWFQDEARIGQKTRSPAAGQDAGRDLPRQTTRGRVRPPSSAPFAPPREKVPGSFFPLATPRPWLSIWRKSRLRGRPALMRSFFSIRPGGMSRRSFSQTTSALAVAAEVTRAQPGGKYLACATTGSPLSEHKPCLSGVMRSSAGQERGDPVVVFGPGLGTEGQDLASKRRNRGTCVAPSLRPL